MKLGDILSGCEYEIVTSNEAQVTSEEQSKDLSLSLDREISGVAYDSRKVARNGMFVAIKGENLDGHDFISDAIGKGAVVIVSQQTGVKTGRRGLMDSPTILIKAKDSRRALACMANNFYRRPSENVSVIGVTGTNGKTTTSYLIKSILEAWEKKAGLIGTIAYLIGDRAYPAPHTTPESLEFQCLLYEMASAGCSHVVTEVSSHALFQRRVDFTRFVVAVFTNLTRDHLDFHETMEKYFEAKERLFTELLSEAGTAVINADDVWGRKLLKDLGEITARDQGDGCAAIITYGIDGDADVSASQREDSLSGVSFTLTCKGGTYRMDSPFIGVPNVYNILAAISVGIALNIPMEVIQEGIRNIPQVKGRLERVDAGQDFLCIIDYAHTPDALERLILTARELMKESGISPQANHRGDRSQKSEVASSLVTLHASPQIITLFGCGGDRDRGKRPVMGELATRLSDYVIITSDNPRSEDPGEIIREIVSGISMDNYAPVPDRRDAVISAVGKAGTGDILLIAGKGHEEYQEIKGVRHRFSDREVVEEAIRTKLRKMQDTRCKMQE